MMENFKVIILIMAVLIGLSAFIDKIKLPYPVLLVLAGLIIAFIPGVPRIILNPDVIFVVILPPLLYDAASRTSWKDFKANIRPISALGVNLVFFTVLAVAITAYYFIPAFNWPAAFLLGAIIAPPDAVAATGILKGLSLNKQVSAILEGESLVNDAAALIAYRYALIAVLTGSFVLWQAALQFIFVAAGGILIGGLIGYIITRIHNKIHEQPIVETCFTLLTPFVVYYAAEQIGASGILSVVSAGLVVSVRSSEVFSYDMRLQTTYVWDTIMFLLNGFVFISIGLQLPVILQELNYYSWHTLLLYSSLISVVTIGVRIGWVFSGAYFARLFKWKKTGHELGSSETDHDDTWKNVMIVAWTGTRGVLSMAAALALPLTLYSGKPFPERALIVFLCFVVIFVTLVIQGFSLPLLVRWLNIKNTEEDKEERQIQLYLIKNTLHYIDHEYPVPLEESVKALLKKEFEQTATRLMSEIRAHTWNETGGKRVAVRVLTPLQQARIAIGGFQRDLLLKLHKDGKVSTAALKEVERDLDIEELNLNQQLPSKEDQPEN
ncbi:Na+/H+ antiporter [Pinibacter aurantiacus]|nr:Na+/H+ antiporter [Pinibacter aurantiacus]